MTDPGRTTFVEHRGKQICLLDFHGINDTDSALAAIAEARRLIGTQPEKSVRALVYVAGSSFNSEIVAALKDLAAHNKPYVIASAIVGMERLHRVVLTAVATVTRRRFATFTNLELAKDWLTDQQ